MTFDELCDKYPRLFEHLEWSGVGPGWLPLLEELCQELLKLPTKTSIVQVKEKFGQLRVYVEEGDPAAFFLITEAENKSTTICEQCGQPGKIRGKHWLHCCCDACYKE